MQHEPNQTLIDMAPELLELARSVAGEPCRTPRPHPPCRPGQNLCVPCEARALVARAGQDRELTFADDLKRRLQCQRALSAKKGSPACH